MLRNALEPWHLLIVAIMVIMLFGSKKLPEVARGLGRSMRILKSEARAIRNEDAGQQPPATAGDEEAQPVVPAIPVAPEQTGETAQPTTQHHTRR